MCQTNLLPLGDTARMQQARRNIAFPHLLCEVHEQENSRNGEHIDLSVFQMQTGPDKVVITVGRVCTIT